LQDVLATICGSIVGFSLAFIGGGGSILAVPLLIYVVGVSTPDVAIGTSALAVSVNAFANLYAHARSGYVHWREGLTFGVAGIAGSLAGSTIGLLVDGDRLLAGFAVLMIVVALLMLRRREHASVLASGFPRLRLLASGAGAGVLAGFFGIGGGFLIVPALVLSCGMTLVTAIGTSLLSVALLGMTTAANYALADFVEWRIAAEFILGGLAGGYLGVLSIRRLSRVPAHLNSLFAGVLIVVGLLMLYANWPASN
jgi:uncharacterized membrane protein YfcA